MNQKTLFFTGVNLLLLACAEPNQSVPHPNGKADVALPDVDPATIQCVDGNAKAVTLTLAPNGAPTAHLPGPNGLVQATLQTPDQQIELTNLRAALNIAITDEVGKINEFVEFHAAGQATPTPGALPKLHLAKTPTNLATLTFDNGTIAITAQCNIVAGGPLSRLDLRLQTAEALVANLPAGAKVGFDIDDTLLFSSPAMNRGFAIGADGGQALFWSEVNRCSAGCEASDVTLPNGTIKTLPAAPASPAKASVQRLMALHRAAGHEVYAITSRLDHNGDALRAYLGATFDIPAANIYFEPSVEAPNNPAGKTDRITALGLASFYGDSDSDITDARDAGATPIRVLRSPRSPNRKNGYLAKYAPGYFGESILVDSYE